METEKHSLKFVKVLHGAKQDEIKEISDRVSRGELKWHHYTIDGEKGFHYYSILKK